MVDNNNSKTMIEQKKHESPMIQNFDGIDEKKLIRKVDWRLLPILGALYSISFIDRGNIGVARVAGMGNDLQLQIGERYTIILLLFFPSYILFELPSNLVLRKVGVANWLSFIAFSWGIIMIGQAFSQNWWTLAICRVLLGSMEAGFFPGCVYVITCWYVRYETQKRLGAFYLLSVAIGGFANLLAYGLMQMEGLAKLGGWQWIFIIEGIITCVAAILAWFIIIDFPDKAEKNGFLTHSEAAFILQRIENDRGDSVADTLTWTKFSQHIADWKLWAYATLYLGAAMPVYAFSYFQPLILVGMGYTGGEANALSAPPSVAAALVAFGFAMVADHKRVRAPIIAVQCLISITGLMLIAYAKNNGVRYFGIFLGLAGAQGNIPAILAYQSNNIRSQSKRAVGSALQIGFGAIGGIIASTTFRQRDAPRYSTGLWVSTGLQFGMLFILIMTSSYFWKKNKSVDAQQESGETIKPLEGLAGFKYTY